MKYKAKDELGEISRRRGISYYHQIYTMLVRALTEGAIPPGSALPSETEMMERFQVSRNTVRRALGQLEQEKRIVRRRGSGSYARNAPPGELTVDTMADLIREDAAGTQTASRLLRIQSGATPEFVRRRDPLFGAKSLVVQRCRSFKNVPFMLTTSHVPEHLASRLTRRQLGREPVLVALDSLGITPFSAEQTTTAVTADSTAVRYLGVDPAAALLCVHRLVRDGDGRSIEYQNLQIRPDRFLMREHLLINRAPAGLQWSRGQESSIPAWL